MSDNNNYGDGLGLSGTVLVVFIILKLVGVIDWSWLWVLSPLWIDLIFAAIVLTSLYIDKKYHERKWRKK